jgi:hypothetical protein
VPNLPCREPTPDRRWQRSHPAVGPGNMCPEREED